MEQAPVLDGLSLDAFSFLQDGLVAPEVDVCGCEVAEALVIAFIAILGTLVVLGYFMPQITNERDVSNK